ncbi:hypothetical protein Dsin_008046 [Dipteronia sinensis]|uniref:Reverse transcriptase zinc-binding domain-containing protein n=1 Tax=Dipteronia sinensis TaxID=43782 RepID=A0AAE0B2X8_9ROSI|nr:hypothetical protein Dsin_008046 [Dipteronia sinensis]
MQINVSCPICGKHPETIVHALWSCYNIKGLRSACDFLMNIKVAKNMQFLDIMILCISIMRTEEFELLCMMLWRVWFCHNGMIHDSKLFDVSEVMPWATSYIVEFKRANTMDVREAGKWHKQLWKWCPPIADKFKMNTYAAIQSEVGRVGVWIIIRDSTGNVLASSAQNIKAEFSPTIAVAVALLRGL